MKASIQPSVLNGTLTAPASKSSMQRVCALALLHEGTTIIRNYGKSDDDKAAIEIIQKLGATVDFEEDENILLVRGVRSVDNIGTVINCGESGLSVRMFTSIAALSSKRISINGEGSLLTRPLDFFDEVLTQLNVDVKSNNGFLPLQIKGPLIPKGISIDGSLSSQFLTGLLIAFGYEVKEPVTISVSGLNSKPYIDLTLHSMKRFGYNVENSAYQQFVVNPKATTNAEIDFTVEGDWSSASALLVAGALAGNISITGLDIRSTQADRAILLALMNAGIRTSVSEDEISVTTVPGPYKGRAFHFNATDCPDLFPPLVALASRCNGKSVIEGVTRLLHKESNRALALKEEFGKMGVNIDLQDDLMIIEGSIAPGSGIFHSHHDHRIAMACAIAGLNAESGTTIEDADAVKKSYPGFFDDLKKLGANIFVS